MKAKELEKAQAEYVSKFWYDRDEQQKQVAQISYRAGAVWLLRQLTNKAWNDVLDELIELEKDLKR